MPLHRAPLCFILSGGVHKLNLMFFLNERCPAGQELTGPLIAGGSILMPRLTTGAEYGRWGQARRCGSSMKSAGSTPAYGTLLCHGSPTVEA